MQQLVSTTKAELKSSPRRLCQVLMAGLVMAIPTATAAQGLAATAGPARPLLFVQEPAEHEEEEEHEHEGPVEGEFVASTIFQGATLAVRLREPLALEMHYFGVEENDIGMVGLAWTFRWRELRVSPGLAWAFGAENRPAPVITARWTFESERWLTQGLFVQSLRAYVPGPGSPHEGSPHEGEEHGGEEAAIRHASILDGIHVSARIGRAEIGPLVENIRYREEHEWKGGVRVAWRVGHHLKLIGQVLGPGTEVRGGLAWEP